MTNKVIKKHRHYFKWNERCSVGHTNIGFFKCKCGEIKPGFQAPGFKPLTYENYERTKEKRGNENLGQGKSKRNLKDL